MAAITVTATSVLPYAGASAEWGTFGETVTAGMAVYQSSTDDKYYKLDANDSTKIPAAGKFWGIALTGGAAGQPAKVQTGGDINPGGTVVVGTVYVAGATAGDIAPVSDLTTGWYTNVIGVGVTSSKIRMSLLASGVAVP